MSFADFNKTFHDGDKLIHPNGLPVTIDKMTAGSDFVGVVPCGKKKPFPKNLQWKKAE